MAGYLCAGDAGVIEHTESGRLLAYPNPAIPSITIEGASAGALRVFDATGRELINQFSNTERRMLELGAFPNGAYTPRDAACRTVRFMLTR